MSCSLLDRRAELQARPTPAGWLGTAVIYRDDDTVCFPALRRTCHAALDAARAAAIRHVKLNGWPLVDIQSLADLEAGR